MPNKKIIVGIEFNNRSKPNNRWKVGLTKSWIEYRMSIFMKYTLQSLKKQTHQNFTALIRYADESEPLIRQTLAKYAPLPKNIRFVPESLYLQTQKKLADGYKLLYLVRLDCDDTYHKSFIRQLHNYKPKRGTRALINQKGYIYDSLRRRIATVKKSSPPFYTFIYKTSEYFNGKRYATPRGHSSVIQHKHEILTKKGKRNYMVVVHERNTLNQRLLSKKNFKSKPSKVKAVLKKFI
ncbi:glycosyltransferase [Paenibacillus ehimensis]|uniref:Glycosyltransferase n=1 Tax=Paenibacillus ehimensis TaxID=79264 RepID=A0ABT8V6R4_9BACL|nr:glycosyltransferase [Paenibacillus ehimensis]MDO3676162.1 glycosyltransferase [Paenibacillus ehimensis]MEC0210155.1 glycosyltransferase [Paenibacillus ehimensis]